MQSNLKQRFTNSSLELRTSTGALFLIIIAATFLLFQLQQQQREQFQNEYRDVLKNNIQQNETILQLRIDSLRRDVQFLARIPPVQGIIRSSFNKGIDPQESIPTQFWNKRLLEIISAFAEARPEYYQIRFIGVADNGRELVRVDAQNGHARMTPPDKLQAKGDRDYFKATLKLGPGEVYLSDFNLNQEFGKIEVPHRPTLRAATPIFMPDGKIFGMVIINLDVAPLLVRMTTGLPPSVHVYLTNTDGDYLLHPDPGKTFGFDWGPRYRWQQDYPNFKIQPHANNNTAELMQTIDSTQGLMHIVSSQVYFDPHNPERFLLLFNTLPDATITKKSLQILGTNIVAISAGLLVIIVLVLLTVRRMFAPFGRLIEAANSIAEGNYEKPLPDDKTGDIGRLARAFNDMQAQIKFREMAIRQLNADLEQRVEQRTLELTNANRELESFAYAVSHDLRAPLRAMSGFSQALAEDYGHQLQGEAKSYLDQIVIASHKMSELIDGLLLLSRCTRGELQRDTVNISDLSRRLLDDLAKQFPARKIAVTIEAELQVDGDARMIEVVMSNLLGNAWKYTAHTTMPSIQVYAEEQDGRCYYCVADNGAGFDMSHSNRLFQPFQRLHRQDEFPGIGIGLATIQRIVHRHGGIINARGKPGKGAIFCFTLSREIIHIKQHEEGG